MPFPATGTYPAYFEKYINLVETQTPYEAIEKYSASFIDFFTTLPSDKLGFRYAEGKWTIKELVQHLIDAERIFSYRALRISRKDKTPLPGFDEKEYADAAPDVNERDWQNLLEEFFAVRKSSDLLIKSFKDEQLQQMGTTDGKSINVNAIAFIIFGHIIHHKNIIEERYL